MQPVEFIYFIGERMLVINIATGYRMRDSIARSFLKDSAIKINLPLFPDVFYIKNTDISFFFRITYDTIATCVFIFQITLSQRKINK